LFALEREQWREAETEAETCIAAYEKSGAKPDDPALAGPLGDLANAQLGAVRYATAIATYTRVLGLLDRNPSDPLERAAIHFGLGKALGRAGDHEKSLGELAEAARLARAEGHRGDELARSIEALRAAHP
jgi:tetratricopeptide (TPR) repeat protein